MIFLFHEINAIYFMIFHLVWIQMYKHINWFEDFDYRIFVFSQILSSKYYIFDLFFDIWIFINCNVVIEKKNFVFVNFRSNFWSSKFWRKLKNLFLSDFTSGDFRSRSWSEKNSTNLKNLNFRTKSSRTNSGRWMNSSS